MRDRAVPAPTIRTHRRADAARSDPDAATGGCATTERGSRGIRRPPGARKPGDDGCAESCSLLKNDLGAGARRRCEPAAIPRRNESDEPVSDRGTPRDYRFISGQYNRKMTGFEKNLTRTFGPVFRRRFPSTFRCCHRTGACARPCGPAATDGDCTAASPPNRTDACPRRASLRRSRPARWEDPPARDDCRRTCRTP